MIEVYYAPPSMYGRKVLAVLEEKGLDYTIKPMSFKTQDHLKPEYTKINPNGEIPAISDEGFTIYESTAIIEYLEDEYPEPRLMPEDSEGRARVRMIDDFCDLHAYPPVVKCFIKKVLRKEELTDEDLAPVTEAFRRLGDYLGKKQCIAVEPFTLADCAVMPVFASAEGLGFKDKVIATEPMKKYFSRLQARPGWKGASLFSLEAATAK